MEVRRSDGTRVEGTRAFSFQRLVSWERRAEYPMLGHIDPVGETILNRYQLETLGEELESLSQMIHKLGSAGTAELLGAGEVPDSMRIRDWDPESDFVDLLKQLQLAVSEARSGVHRYLWFSGD